MIKLKWLSGEKDHTVFGLPHKRGEISNKDTFVLKTDNGVLPVQSYPMAYWNDGSVKWNCYCVSDIDHSENYILEKGRTDIISRITVSEDNDTVTVDTGAVKAVIGKRGTDIIREIYDKSGKIRSLGGRLVLFNENRYKKSGYETTVTESFKSVITECIVTRGDIKTVVRLKGCHSSQNMHMRNGGERRFIPFDLRLYFFADSDEIKIKHTFLFDGQEHTDFIKGIGIEFDVNLSGELYNRYVRFTGESGVFSDAPKDLLTWRTTDKYHDLYEKQTHCEKVGFDEKEDERFMGLLNESAVWNDFKITQLSSAEYNIQKRTGEGCVYICGNTGKRAMGTGCLSDEFGSFSVHLRDFWQKYPSGIEFKDTAKENSKAVIWLWTPDSNAMDLRHYDTRCHVYSGYEGFDEMRATPYGIANTNEITVKISEKNPSNDEFLSWSRNICEDLLFIAEDAKYYNGCEVLGIWADIDRSTPKKAAIEEHLDEIIGYYKRERETKNWYGFWNYGDFMHTYDDVHHSWKYDMGGQAWQNTELAVNMWLWYQFIRSGRSDIFSMARAMTEHTSEVDIYHIGVYAHLGSRHNVVHWGCGCKECRICMAGLHKYYYYLTGDERTGDIMDEVVDSDFAVGELDPMRAYFPPDSRFKAHIRFGPDVMAFCSNWFTYYERHLDEKYKAKLEKTLAFFKRDHRFVISGIYGYNPENTEYFDFEVKSGSHFMLCFGNPFVWYEIAKAFDDNEIIERMMDLGQLYGNSESTLKFRKEKCAEWGITGFNEVRYKHSSYNTGVSAMAAKLRGIDELAREVIECIFNDEWVDMPLVHHKVTDCHKEMVETLGISTNGVGQWVTNTLMALAFIGDMI